MQNFSGRHVNFRA